MRRGLGAGVAGAAPVIGDGAIAGAQAVELGAPHAAIAHRGMQEDHGNAIAHGLRGQYGLAAHYVKYGMHA
ncbi:Uncharacterised protein [Achromobacter sp. 2789STDY5608621]|nr:Uncharacterised protein [Achromobacter sp. 2789STDY5608621]